MAEVRVVSVFGPSEYATGVGFEVITPEKSLGSVVSVTLSDPSMKGLGVVMPYEKCNVVNVRIFTGDTEIGSIDLSAMKVIVAYLPSEEMLPPTTPLPILDLEGEFIPPNGDDAMIYLAWNAPGDGGNPILGYKLFRDDVLLATLGPGVLDYEDFAILDGNTYDYFIEAFNVIGDAPPSNVVSVEYPEIPPPAPGPWQTVVNLFNGNTVWRNTGGISAQGKHMIASQSDVYYGVGPNSYTYVSHNYGQDWFTAVNAGSRDWSPGGISENGQIIILACSQNLNGVIRRSIDGGLTWTDSVHPPFVPFGDLWDVSMSNDGQHVLVCGASGQQLLVSHDYGATFVYAGSAKDYKYCDVSGTGQYMVATGGALGSYYPSFSSDYGATWTDLLPAGARNYMGCAVSDDGQKILLTTYNAGVYLSTDGGASFTMIVALGNGYRGVASMAGDGSRMGVSPLATVSSKPQESIDGGVTWRNADFPVGNLPATTQSGSFWISRNGAGALYYPGGNVTNVYTRRY